MEFNFPKVCSLLTLAAKGRAPLKTTRTPDKSESHRPHLVENPSGKSARCLRLSFACVGTRAMVHTIGKFTTRWKDHRRHGRTTISKRNQFEIPRLRLPRQSMWTAMKLLEALNQHVSSTNDSIGNWCTAEMYYYRILCLGMINVTSGYGQASSKRPTRPPESRNHQRTCRTFWARVLGLRPGSERTWKIDKY